MSIKWGGLAALENAFVEDTLGKLASWVLGSLGRAGAWAEHAIVRLMTVVHLLISKYSSLNSVSKL